jgi:hypothetical protein
MLHGHDGAVESTHGNLAAASTHAAAHTTPACRSSSSGGDCRRHCGHAVIGHDVGWVVLLRSPMCCVVCLSAVRDKPLKVQWRKEGFSEEGMRAMEISQFPEAAGRSLMSVAAWFLRSVHRPGGSSRVQHKQGREGSSGGLMASFHQQPGSQHRARLVPGTLTLAVPCGRGVCCVGGPWQHSHWESPVDLLSWSPAPISRGSNAAQFLSQLRSFERIVAAQRHSCRWALGCARRARGSGSGLMLRVRLVPVSFHHVKHWARSDACGSLRYGTESGETCSR